MDALLPLPPVLLFIFVCSCKMQLHGGGKKSKLISQDTQHLISGMYCETSQCTRD